MAEGGPPTPLLRAALLGRCPRCGDGRIFLGLLEIRDRCPVCDLDLRGSDTGDGAVFIAIMILGVVIVAAAAWVEVAFHPPLWVHAVIWPLVTLPAAVLIMRPAKATLIALQYRYRAREMGL